jgi:CO dehydrogenase/acetyl-CoA synthase beta subunit
MGGRFFCYRYGICQGLGFHDHAAPTAIGTVIHGIVPVCGKIAYLDGVPLYQLMPDGPGDHAMIKKGLNQFRKKRKYRKIHDNRLFISFGQPGENHGVFKIHSSDKLPVHGDQDLCAIAFYHQYVMRA